MNDGQLFESRDGGLAYWSSNNGNLALTPLALPAGSGVGHDVDVVADFDDDGRTDIGIRKSSGALQFWFLSGSAVDRVLSATGADRMPARASATCSNCGSYGLFEVRAESWPIYARCQKCDHQWVIGQDQE